MKSPLVLLPLFLSIHITRANPVPAPAPAPIPPNIPSGSIARSQLSALRVAPVGSQAGYSRELFPHWSTQSGTCNTREVVLKRDGTDVVQDPSSCAAVSGRWYSPFDGETWTQASDVDIDHLVPLSNAWKVSRRYLLPVSSVYGLPLCPCAGQGEVPELGRMSKEADQMCLEHRSQEPHHGHHPAASNSPTTLSIPSSSL